MTINLIAAIIGVLATVSAAYRHDIVMTVAMLALSAANLGMWLFWRWG